MHSIYFMLSIISTIILTSIFYLIKRKDYKKITNQLFYCGLSGTIASLLDTVIVRSLVTTLLSIIGPGGGENTFFLISSLTQNIIKFLVVYGILIVFLNKNFGVKKKYDGIIFAVFINSGYLFVKFLSPGVFYGIFPAPYTMLLTTLISFASAITLGYFIGFEKMQEKRNIELHFLGVGGAIFIGTFYFVLTRYLVDSTTIKIIYLASLVALSVYLTKSHFDESKNEETI